MLRQLIDSFGSIFSKYNLLILLVIIVLATAAGPFGTYAAQGFWQRLAYWALVVVASATLGHFCLYAARRIAGQNRPVLADLAMIALMTVAFTPILWILTSAFNAHGSPVTPSLAELSLYVAIVTAGVCFFRRILPGFEPVGYFSFGAGSPTPRLLNRLPEDFQGPILRLTVRDHFVDVVAADTSHSIRLRFGDAINEMEPVSGFYTHRSHWVAREAIAGTEQNEGRPHLRLVNGDLVPVSRKYKPDLEEAGLL